MVESDPEEVADHIPYGSANKIPCSSIDWVDRDTLGIKDVGGKEFNFHNKFFGVNGIVIAFRQPQILKLQPLDTSHTYAQRCILNFLWLRNFGMQRMSSKHMLVSQERMTFLMEGVLFSVKSQKRFLVLDQPMMGLMHPHLW